MDRICYKLSLCFFRKNAIFFWGVFTLVTIYMLYISSELRPNELKFSEVLRLNDIRDKASETHKIHQINLKFNSNKVQRSPINQDNFNPRLKDEIDQIRNLPKFPYIAGLFDSGGWRNTNITCNRYPTRFDIRYNNHDWQIHTSREGTNFYMYNAYLDSRPCDGRSMVRMLGMVDNILPLPKTYCQFWYNDRRLPIINKMVETSYVWYPQWGNNDTVRGLQPYLLSCPLPKTGDSNLPNSVSLADSLCMNATTNLLIFNERPRIGKETNNFAVCVKGLDFIETDISDKLIEWIELIFLLGADKIFFYVYENVPNVNKVLEYYNKTGKVVLTPLSLPGGQPNAPMMRHEYFLAKGITKRQSEVITYNDCLYRNLYTSNFVTLLDIDEIIVPTNEMNWVRMMIKVVDQFKEQQTAYCFQNIYFLEGSFSTNFVDETTQKPEEEQIPKYFHMLRHVRRSANYTTKGHYVKCFHSTKRVIAVHNHYPLECYMKNNGSRYCYPASVEVEDGRLNHYRKDCVANLKKVCEGNFKKYSVIDKSVWRYREELTLNVEKSREEMGFDILK